MGRNKKQHKKSKKIDEQNDTNKEDENIAELDIENEASITKSPSKRSYSENESDNDNEPKKKKKKNTIQRSGGTSDNKNKKSIRQAKREKFALRQAETQAAAKEQIKSECLFYLSQWKHNRQNWKFMKAKQVWLYKNKFSETLVPNDSWSLLMEYFESAKGNIRNMLLTDANKVIKQMDDWTEIQKKEEVELNENEGSDDEEKSKKPSEIIYKRARELIQFLQE